MAVYKIFPYQDTSLYSMYPTMNTGIDPINQISNLNFAIDTQPSVARTLIQFDSDEIDDTITNIIQDSESFEARLRCYIATAQGIVESSTVEVWPIAVGGATGELEWNMGTGTYLDQPLTTDGACWESPFFANGNQWPINVPDNYGTPTGSYNTKYASVGGGAWYTASTAPGSSQFAISTSFTPRSDKDLNIPVTDIVKAWTGSYLPNHGFLLKWETYAEFNPNTMVQPVMQYYSVDTNTIYPPELEFRWDDSSWDTGSSATTVLNEQNMYISLAENPGVFFSESINRFRLNVRPKYPKREFVTGSLYTKQYYLPSASAWYAVKDLDTNEFVVDFDNNYTKVSADATSSYFDLYMNGFEPERYYQVLVKVNAGDSTTIYDNEYYFKIVNG
jgi:hypothetical protein